MLRLLSAALVVAALLWPALPASAETRFTALLTGDQQVPTPVVSNAIGTASLRLNDARTRLEIVVQLAGVDLDGTLTPGTDSDDVFAMHIHSGGPGVNGNVVFGFILPDNDTSGDLSIDAANGLLTSGWDAAEGQLTTLTAELPNLFAGDLYFNVHTVANSPGEIRGAILLSNSVPGLGLPGQIALALLLLGVSWLRLSRDRTPG